MNDSTNLDLYFKIRQFKDDLSKEELLLPTSRSKQIIIDLIANSFNLEYEYSTRTGIARITRPESTEAKLLDAEGVIDQSVSYMDHLNDGLAHAEANDLYFDAGLPNTQMGGDTFPSPSIMDSHAFMAPEDFFLPSRFFEQNTGVHLRPAASNSDHSNMMQEIDDFLSATQTAEQDQQAFLFGRRNESKNVDVRGESTINELRVGPLSSKTVQPPALRREESTRSSASGASGASTGSGRRGPLSDWARAGMNAVKKVGACWRCIILRKKVGSCPSMALYSRNTDVSQCDPQNPCLICPKGEKSNWEALGCHRGDFKTRMLPLQFCPAECDKEYSPHGSILEHEVNSFCRAQCKQRELWVNNEATITSTDEPPSMNDTRRRFIEKIAGKRNHFLTPDATVIDPLQNCILSIVWEFLETPSSLTLLDRGGSEKGLRILSIAALHQANLESVRGLRD